MAAVVTGAPRARPPTPTCITPPAPEAPPEASVGAASQAEARRLHPTRTEDGDEKTTLTLAF
ncbi:hypothetical protein E2C01_038631 [Portunus trituberculatus]|uniref:Uncharacterized protein n=1 Tax=Portunus trituberculatus TaxID=210409 RepID=A0A5B7FBB1_PORTR|nr:hypothetical protein [Portunus trituberculatus]